MSVITILEKQVFTFEPWINDGVFFSGDKTNTWTEQNIELNTEYLVTWDNGIVSNEYSTYAVQKNWLCLGNLSIYNDDEVDTGEPFFLALITFSDEPPSIALFLTNDSSATKFSMGIKRNINDNVVLYNPRGYSVTYGEYDTVLLNAAGGHKLYYHRLPGLTEADNGKILMAQDSLWKKTNIPQSDWTQTDTNAADFIKNKPSNMATTQWVQEQITAIPKQQQADWKETKTNSPAFILNKPTIPDPQIQSDWNQTNTDAKDYIKNVPKAFQHDEKLVETTQSVLLDTPEGWIKKEVPQLLMTVTFEDETVKNYHIVGTEVIV